jgi:hypothetical protein
VETRVQSPFPLQDVEPRVVDLPRILSERDDVDVLERGEGNEIVGPHVLRPDAQREVLTGGIGKK